MNGPRTETKAPAPSDADAAMGAGLRYSIQLISFQEKASLARFAREQGLVGTALQLESMGPPARWHAVLLGAFTDHAMVEAALHDLPARLRRLSPFVRPLVSGERLVPIGGP